VTAALVAVRALARTYFRHLALGSAGFGLLAGPRSALVLLVGAALLAGLAGTPPRALAVLGFALLGAVAAQARLAHLDATRLRPALGGGVQTRAILLERLRAGQFDSTALARFTAGPGRGEKVLLRVGRWVRWTVAPVGAELALDGRLAALGPHDGYQRIRGAHAVLRVRTERPTGRRREGVAGAVDRVRERMERSLELGLPPPQAALLRGMTLGQDEGLDAPTRDDFRASGLTHILAASGQNIVLLAALAVPLLGLLGLGLRSRLAVVLGLIALYVPLAGAGPSVQRAGVMGAAGVVAALAGRPSSRWYAIGLALVATLLLNPRAAEDPGWQLSFAAVLSMLLLVGRVRERLERSGFPPTPAEAAAVTLAATLGTAPLIALHFDRVSFASVPANLLAAPAIAPVMWLGMLAGTVGSVWAGAASALNALNAYPLAYLGWTAHATAHLPMASVAVPSLPPAAIVALYAAAGAIIAVRRLRRPALLLATACASLVLLAPASAGPRPPPGLRVSFLDVGQGDATLIQDGEHAILVDAGPPDGPILPRLAHEGVTRLDALVVTHAQADHEGGAPAVLRRYPVDLLLDGAAGAPVPGHQAVLAAAAAAHARVLAPDAGQAIRAGRAQLDVLWPHAEPYALHAQEDPNQRAIVAEVTAPGLRMLLPADAESDVTAALDLPPVDVLKVAHHGSADPGLPDLLARLRPRLAVIEVGAHNTYGHPSPQALGALRGVPQVLRTDRDGTVRLTEDKGRLALHTHS
jgi:competence protein ComEC